MEEEGSRKYGAGLLRDSLAFIRTALANERTLLAYIRTSLTFFVAGVSLNQFFDSRLVRIAGLTFLPLAGFFMVLGVIRFFSTRRRIARRSKPRPEN
jgi:putative membrane protein